MDNGDGKALPSCLYPIKYLNESLLCDFLSDNIYFNIYFVNINSVFVFMKSTFNDAIFSEMYRFLLHFYTTRRKKIKILYFNFLASQ